LGEESDLKKSFREAKAMAVQDAGREDPGQAAKARYLAKCVLHSSVVLQAVYGHIRSPTTCDIVFGKVLSHLPIFSAKEFGALSCFTQMYLGHVKFLHREFDLIKFLAFLLLLPLHESFIHSGF